MPMPQTLNDIIPVLKNSYRGADIRAVLVKSKSEDKWYYAILKIRLTRDTPTNIRRIHDKKKDELSSIDYDDFKLIFYSLDIEQLGGLLHEIHKGPIKLAGFTAMPIGTEFQNIFDDLQHVRNSIYSTEQERDGFNDVTYFVSKREKPETLVRNLGVRVEDYNFNFNEFCSWLDIAKTALSNSNYIVIIFRLYCKQVGGPFSNENGKLLAKYVVSRPLIGQCIAIIKSYDGEVLNRLELKDAPLFASGFEKNAEMDIISIPMMDTISSGISVQIEVRHNILQEISNNRITWNEIMELERLYSVMKGDDKHSLSDIFRLSRAAKKFGDYLNSNDDSTQVSATTWLLTLLGFNSINLGAISQGDEPMMQGLKPLHAVDIISHNPGNRFFLACDCTINVPPDDKIDKIRNAANFIGSEINISVIPVIFCNKDCKTSYQHAKDTGVRIIDVTYIARLYKLILDGQMDKAITLFHNLIVH